MTTSSSAGPTAFSSDARRWRRGPTVRHPWCRHGSYSDDRPSPPPPRDGRPAGPLAGAGQPTDRLRSRRRCHVGPPTHWAWRRVDAAVKLISRHSYSLLQPPGVVVRRAGGLGLPLLHLSVGGQRQDTGHGRHGPAGGDAAGRSVGGGRSMRCFGPWGSGSPSSPWASASSGLCSRRERRALDDFVAGTAVVYDWDARAAHLRSLARAEGAPHRSELHLPGLHER